MSNQSRESIFEDIMRCEIGNPGDSKSGVDGIEPSPLDLPPEPDEDPLSTAWPPYNED